MLVRITDSGTTGITLDFNQALDVQQDPIVQEAIMAFTVIERQPHIVVLDVSPNLVEAADFLIQAIRSTTSEVDLSETLKSHLDAAKEEREQLHDARSAGAEAPGPPPAATPILGVELLPHQERGLRKALQVKNLAEFSVQGAGKTLIALSAYRTWKSQGLVGKLLVIGPTSSRKPWEDEVVRWLGPTAVLRWSGAATRRMRLVPEFATADIVLCTYDTAIRDSEMLSELLRRHPTLLVLDESHYIKNFDGGARVQMALRLAPLAARRMILSGTPAPHSTLDIWNQMAFLWPSQVESLLGKRQTFLAKVQQTPNIASIMGDQLAPLFHRTTQAELNLPEPTRTFAPIPRDQVPPEQARILQILGARLLAEVNAIAASEPNRELATRWRKVRIIRLLQAASNPGLLFTTIPWLGDGLNDIETSDLADDILRFSHGDILSSKVAWTVTKTRELVSHGRKVVIWSWWVNNLLLLSQLLGDLNPLVVYGGIKPYQDDWDDDQEVSRERNIAQFKSDSASMVLIANPAACAESISLHRECHDAIYLDRTFNCGQFLQSMNRIHRVGLPLDAQTNYWIPFLDCAIERAVDRRLTSRQQVLYSFLNDPAAIVGFNEDEETDLSDTEDEVEAGFAALGGELRPATP